MRHRPDWQSVVRSALDQCKAIYAEAAETGNERVRNRALLFIAQLRKIGVEQ